MMHKFYVSAYCYWFVIKYPVVFARWGDTTHRKHCFVLPECNIFDTEVTSHHYTTHNGCEQNTIVDI